MVVSPLADLSPLDYALLLVAGLFAGVINTVAGGGSALTLPALIIIAGIPPGIANATNRIGVILQNMMAIRQFRAGGVREDHLSWRATAVAVAGAVAGTKFAALIPDDKFRFVLGILLPALLPLLLWKPKSRPVDGEAPRDAWRTLSARERWTTLVAFFFIGAYSGFLQAGVGVVILAALSWTARIDLVRGNYVKLVVILATMVVSLATFLLSGVKVVWLAGLIVGTGQVVGALAGSWVAIKKGETWIKSILVVSILISSAKLLGLF